MCEAKFLHHFLYLVSFGKHTLQPCCGSNVFTEAKLTFTAVGLQPLGGATVHELKEDFTLRKYVGSVYQKFTLLGSNCTDSSTSDNDVTASSAKSRTEPQRRLHAQRLCTHLERTQHLQRYCNDKFGYPLARSLRKGDEPRGFSSTKVSFSRSFVALRHRRSVSGRTLRLYVVQRRSVSDERCG